jgi:transcriptional regulator with XRE-family HTH domain
VHTRLDGEALQRARSTKGLTHHQLARMVHASVGERILRFERGANEPNPRMIVALAEALGVDPMQPLLLPNRIDLEALRLASGRGAADLAQSVHVSRRAYLNWESGRELPLEDQRILAALARELGVSTAQIVTALRRHAADVRETDRDG